MPRDPVTGSRIIINLFGCLFDFRRGSVVAFWAEKYVFLNNNALWPGAGKNLHTRCDKSDAIKANYSICLVLALGQDTLARSLILEIKSKSLLKHFMQMNK